MVKPGCTITFWRDYGYEGESWEKVAPAGGLLQPDNRAVEIQLASFCVLCVYKN